MSTPVRFPVGSDGDGVVGRHHAGSGDDFASAGGRPCVVMAHGLGGTRDSGLDEFAAALAAGGVDVLAFDYRHFGESDGEPRQLLSVRRQLADYRAAIAFARTLGGVDPSRIVLWGTSFSGGHVLRLAAEHSGPGIAAVISLTPNTDGRAAMAHAVRNNGPGQLATLLGRGLADAARATVKRELVTVRVTGQEGDRGAAMAAPGVYEGYTSITGPSWRNELTARSILAFGLYRPGRAADQIRCPVLVQIADDDLTAPPRAAEKAAEKARAEVRHYPCDHMDVYHGGAWFERVVEHQLFFLRRHLAREGDERARAQPMRSDSETMSPSGPRT